MPAPLRVVCIVINIIVPTDGRERERGRGG